MGEVLSILPMNGTYLTPQSVRTVRAHTGVIRTAIYVAVTIGGHRQLHTHHTRWRMEYLLCRHHT